MRKILTILNYLLVLNLVIVQAHAGQEKERPKEGTIFPDFSATTMNGASFTLFK